MEAGLALRGPSWPHWLRRLRLRAHPVPPPEAEFPIIDFVFSVQQKIMYLHLLARPGRGRRRGAASNPRRKRPPRREERADPVVAKVYMYAPVAVDRECAGRHPRHHAQVRVRLATCTATSAMYLTRQTSRGNPGGNHLPLCGWAYFLHTCVARRRVALVSVGTSNVHGRGSPTAA